MFRGEEMKGMGLRAWMGSKRLGDEPMDTCSVVCLFDVSLRTVTTTNTSSKTMDTSYNTDAVPKNIYTSATNDIKKYFFLQLLQFLLLL